MNAGRRRLGRNGEPGGSGTSRDAGIRVRAGRKGPNGPKLHIWTSGCIWRVLAAGLMTFWPNVPDRCDSGTVHFGYATAPGRSLNRNRP